MSAWLAGASTVDTEEQLRALVGEPSPLVTDKVIDHVDAEARRFVDASPLHLLATRGRDGALDVSPRGDPPGSVLVADDGRSLVVADRLGNRRVDSFRNVLHDPQVGMLFLVPGMGETLRVNGRATVVSDAPFLDRMVIRGKRPGLAMVIDVEELFLHCAKAFLRSSLWDPQAWPERSTLPRAAAIFKAHAGLGVPERELAEGLAIGYRDHQY